jgi:hypothetical protein
MGEAPRAFDGAGPIRPLASPAVLSARVAIVLMTASALGTSVLPPEKPAAFRTRGAVSARPQCGYSEEWQNLLPDSTRFPEGVWRPEASTPELRPTVEPSAEISPSGARDAARVTFDTRSPAAPGRWSCFGATATVIPGETYTFSFSVKGPQGGFITARGAAGAGFSRIPLNGRWQRVHLTEVATSPSPALRIGLGAHDAAEAPVSSSVTVFLWGPQLTLGREVLPYRPSGDRVPPAWPLAFVPDGTDWTACPPAEAPEPAATNLLRWTGTLRPVVWVREGLSAVAPGHGPTPIGRQDGYHLSESREAGPHSLSQRFGVPSPGPVVGSVFIRPQRRTCCRLLLRIPGGGADARFDLASRTATPASAETTARIDVVGKGWMRIQVSAEATATGQGQFEIRLLEDADGNGTYEGDGEAGFVVWGPQVETGTSATSYIPTFFVPASREADEPIVAATP